jgi:hypothetical protein
MSALNFPQNPSNGNTYTGDNGITYTYNNGKWVGTGALSLTVPDHLLNGSQHLTLNANGSVQFLGYLFPAGDGAAGYLLKTDGAGTLAWHPDNNTGYGTLDNLTDVTITSPTTGQVLKYNGSQWVNE